jgi:cysteine desulfurase
MTKRIYLDNAATTPLDPQVIEAMQNAMIHHYGNPSSIHNEGRSVRTVIENARKVVAKSLNASISEIFFTSCGTESNNMVLKNAIKDLDVKHIITSRIEHHCVLNTVLSLQKNTEVTISWVQLDEYGMIDMVHLEQLLANNADKTLVSLMHANNELGNLIDLKIVGELCRKYKALFHTDTVQTIGYYPIDLTDLKIDFLSGSSHKFHGPKGAGFLYINHDNILSPFIDGGSQERNMRGGTENTIGIVGLSKALEIAIENMQSSRSKIEALKQYAIEKITNNIYGVQFNGNQASQHYKILSISFPPTSKTELLVFNLDINGIAVSGGSACSSGVESASHVLSTVMPDSDMKTIRVSFAHYNTFEEIDYLIEMIKKSI